MMVGWAESRHSALSKYASIYTDLGVPCIGLAAGVPLIWFNTLGNSTCQKMLHLLDHSLELPTSLLLHIFSGGGTIVFSQLIREYAKPDSLLTSKLRPAGVVFDSAPTQFSIQSGLAASKLVYNQGGINLITYLLISAAGSLMDIAVGSRKRSQGEATLAHPQLLQLPQLYLYSEADTVTPPERVRKVMEGQKEKGREVTGRSWPDTEHVRHYAKYPVEYTKQIVDFMASLHNTK